MKFFILLGLISLSWATGLTIDLTKVCLCANFLEEKSCTEMQIMCIWKNNSCQIKTCEEFKSQTDCPESPIGNNLICEWDTTCKPAVGGNCKSYSTDIQCNVQSKQQNCVWNNNSCEAFTKCSDYVPGISGCSSKSGKFQACQNNAAGTACENASKDTVTCDSYLTIETCTTTYNGMCIWNEKCQELNSCTQVPNNQCSSLPFFCKMEDSSCKNIVCSDYQYKSECFYIQDFGVSPDINSLSTIRLCSWNKESSKCAEATVDDVQTWTTMESCLTNSLTSYYWDGNKCKQCSSSGSNSSSNTNSSGSDPSSNSPTSGSDSNSSNSNSNNSNSSTGLISDLTKACPCANFLNQQDCIKAEKMCIWKNYSCELRKCEEFTSQTDCPENPVGTQICEWDTTCKSAVGGNCKKYTYEQTCNVMSRFQNCVWHNYSCAAFTKCSDYVPGTSGCSSKSGRFQACKNNAAGTACEDASKDSVTCDSYLTVQVCTTTYNGRCVWDQKCKDFKSCNDLPRYMCSWVPQSCIYDSSCRGKACSDYQTKDECKYINELDFSFDINSYGFARLCQWNAASSKCAPATVDDVSTWTTMETCALNSFFSYYWDGNKCTQCVFSESGYLAVRIIVCLLMLVI